MSILYYLNSLINSYLAPRKHKLIITLLDNKDFQIGI